MTNEYNLPELLTHKDAAKLLGISTRTLSNYTSCGKILPNAYRIVGKKKKMYITQKLFKKFEQTL